MAEMISRATRSTNKNNRVVFRSYDKTENGEFKFITPEITYPQCGEIWKCDLGMNDGSIQSGYRSVFILSNKKESSCACDLIIQDHGCPALGLSLGAHNRTFLRFASLFQNHEQDFYLPFIR